MARDLAFRRGREETSCIAVIGQADAADHSKYVVAVGYGIRQAFEDDEGRALGRHQPIGIGRKGPALAAAAHGLQCAKAYVNK